MSTTFTIAGASRKIIKNSVMIKTGKNGTPDTMNFELAKEETTVPDFQDEVILTIGGTKKFAGRVIRFDRSLNSGDVTKKNVSVQCQDYCWDANKGVAIREIYKNKTVNYIINDLVTNYPQLTGIFTQNNVDCTETIDYLFLDHLKFTHVLKRLADMTGYNFYIDYDKDIHFYQPGKATELATFDVEDTTASYRNGTLRVEKDGTTIINWVLVEGGEYDASKLTTEPFTASGGELEFDLDHFYSGVTVTQNATPRTVGTVGYNEQDGTFDFLYDFNEKKLIVDAATISPADAISVSGYEKLPILIQVSDPVSIADHGILPKPKIKDVTLKTIDSAKQFGYAELGRYASEQENGSFSTFNECRAGQRIRINSTILGIDSNFDVQNTVSNPYGTESWNNFNTNVRIASAEQIDAVGILARLMSDQNKSISSSEILRIFVLLSENVTIADEVEIDPNKYEIDENIEIADEIETAENKTIEWVLSPYVHTTFSDSKRQLTLDNSPCLS